jgi:hypothetical protein
MKIILFLLPLFISFQTYAVNFNTNAFKEKALWEARNFLGSTVEISGDQLLFSDGAYYNDPNEPKLCEDYAAFFFKIKIDDKLLPPDVDLAYQLKLMDGKTRFVFIPRNIEHVSFFVALTNQAIVEFRQDAETGLIEILINKIQKSYPSTSLQYYSSFKLLTYKASSFQEAMAIRNEFKNSDLSRFIHHDTINYKQDHTFDDVILLNTNGTIDASKYRGITKKLEALGCSFSTSTTIPPDLQ